jgi:putative endonuclease
MKWKRSSKAGSDIQLPSQKNVLPYCVYILRCSDETFYTGITTDLYKRIDEHNHSPKGAKYTRSRRPVTLVYNESCENRSEATKREIAIKKMTRSEKEKVIEHYSSSSPSCI